MKKYVFALSITLLFCVCCVFAADINDIEINSKSVYMVNLNNGQVMLDINGEKKMEPASLTKIMTTLVVLENCDDIENERIYIEDDGLFYDIRREGGSNIALRTGETLTVKDLLYATMLPSACDAAELLAYHFGDGDINNFIDMMNERAHQIGAVNTVFKNAHGLNVDGHVTTAYDMSLIAREALKNEQFRKIVSSSSYTIPATQVSAKRDIRYSVELVNRNSSNYYRYAMGIKTGFTDQAGRCLITMAAKDDVAYLLVLMGANLDGEATPIKTYSDAKELFEHAFNAYTLSLIAEKGGVLANSEIYFEDDNVKSIELLAKDDIELILPHGVTPDMLERKYTYKKNLSLPLLSGDELGSVTFSYDGRDIASFEFVSGRNIYDVMPDGEITFYPAKGLNKLTFYKAFFVAGAVICVLCIIVILRSRSRKKSDSARKRNSNR